ncbi:hypothetical protein OSB04_031677 [Centaurea solstitialis]|uniref:Integrase catalytic domain-containing protein n=1 Tax=Centaurea solstitialis TaxID=347529 RepID=A0AA38SB72_9ASTR|nr:hypothetical protein OSB04_031677 [Centaurea solstitialis]
MEVDLHKHLDSTTGEATQLLASQALVSQEGQGFDWSDHAEEAVQNQALMAEIKETEVPTEVSSKLCSDSCLETVKKYRDHNQTMSDSIKKMERERREYVKIIDNLEDQIKAYKANELQFEYDHNYWKWEKKELERKLSKEKEEVESARKELSKAKEDLDKFSKSSKALESIIRAQVTDDLKRGIGHNSTPPPYNQNYIPPTTDLLENIDRSEMKEGLDSVDPVDSEEEPDRKSTAETIPDENHLLTNEKGGMPFVPSKKVETIKKDKGKSVMTSENNRKQTETTRKESRKDHYTQRTIVEPGTSSQSQNKNHPRGNKRNWNNHWAQCHGVDLNQINRPKPCFICCKTNHLARDCYFNPFNQRNKYQARKIVPTHKKVVPKQNKSSQSKRKVQKKQVEKKSVKLVTKWVPKASLSNTTASTSSGKNSVASESSGNSFHSVEVNTAASNISSDNSNTATSQVNTAVSNNSSGNSNNVTTDKSSLRKPIITKYSSHVIPNKDYLLKLNRLTESNQGRRSSLWHVDSGCSRHMTGIMSLLEDFKKFEGGHVAFGDNLNGGKITGKGKVSKGKMTFDDVYFVEQLKYNLLSVSQVCDKKFGVFFTDTECLILAPGYKIDESKVMLRTPRKDNVYCLDIEDASSLSSLNCLFSKASVSESSLWHRRMCHMNFKNMNLLVKNNLVRGLPAKEFSSDDHCVACLKGKQHKNSHKSKEVNTISSPLQLLHMDLFGPTNVMSIGKKSYCLVIVDDYSRFTWVYFLRTKDETSGLIKPFVTRVENKTNLRVKVIRSDNGTEFKNADLNSFCEEKGIERQYSAPRTPQQNGVAERRNRTLIEAARTMLADSKLPITFWAEAVNTACYVQNRVLIVKSKGKTPYELFEKKKPYIGFLQPFGCPCTILDTKTHIHRALCDLGASVSLMPLAIANKVHMGELKATNISLQLVDRSIKYPVGVFEDLPLQVGSFIIPCDFVVLEMIEDVNTPIILGRPFLATAGAIIDIKHGKLSLNVGKEKVEFELRKSMGLPPSMDDIQIADALETVFSEEILVDEEDARVIEEIFDASEPFTKKVVVEPISAMKEDNIVAPPKEMIALIRSFVSSSLSSSQLDKLLCVLRKYRSVLAYSIHDIKGISPSFCTHRILLNDEHASSIEHQRRLNPNMKEVVQKEVMKLLKSGIIYPISDSPWVSPVQVVPKKGGMTVIKNDKGELISTRPVTGWRMCIDYRKLNLATRKDHFPLPFIDQMLERLAKHTYFCYLDGYSGFLQIPIHPNDQEKTTFTCLYGTFAYR